MAVRQAKRIVALLFATMVLAGLGLHSAEAGGMSAGDAVAADMPMSTHFGSCDGGPDAMACPVAACSLPLLAMATSVMSVRMADPSRLLPASVLDPGEWASSPDPNPPQTRVPARLG